MKTYETPTFAVVAVDAIDLIATSGPNFNFLGGTDHDEIGLNIPF